MEDGGSLGVYFLLPVSPLINSLSLPAAKSILIPSSSPPPLSVSCHEEALPAALLGPLHPPPAAPRHVTLAELEPWLENTEGRRSGR